MKISIIIPTYNMEKYLNRCMDSVCAQTYKNIEIICVDDCSIDNTYTILSNYAKTDNRIKVLRNLKNSMVGFSRNTALKYATGKYVVFVDPDDYCDTTLIEKSLNQIVTTQSDCCIFNFNKFDSNTNKISEMPQILYLDNIKRNTEWISSTIDNVFNITTTCSMKMWNIDMIKLYNMQFGENVFGEDSLFTYAGLYYAKRITYIKEPLYYYRINQKTNQTSNLDKRPLDGIITTKEIINTIHINDYSIFEYFIISVLHRLKWIYNCLSDTSKYNFLIKLNNEIFFESLIYHKRFLTTKYFIEFKNFFLNELNIFNI